MRALRFPAGRSWLPLVAPAFGFCHANHIGTLERLPVHSDARLTVRSGARKRDLVAILEKRQGAVELPYGERLHKKTVLRSGSRVNQANG